MKPYFNTQFLFMGCLLYRTGGKVLLLDCCTAELLFVYCLILIPPPSPSPFPLALRRTMYDSMSSHTEGPSEPVVLREKALRIRETGVWLDRWRDEGRQWPHEAPGAVVLLRNMVCVHLKSCRLAFGIVCCVCYVQTLCEKSP